MHVLHYGNIIPGNFTASHNLLLGKINIQKHFTWTISSIGVTLKPSHVPHGARIRHKSSTNKHEKDK